MVVCLCFKYTTGLGTIHFEFKHGCEVVGGRIAVEGGSIVVGEVGR